MKKVIISFAVALCMISGTSEARPQDQKKFCSDVKAALEDIRVSHPEWPFSASPPYDDCLVSIQASRGTDSPILMYLFARVVQSPEQAGEFVEEYRTRMQKVVSDLKRLNRKTLIDNATFVELAPKSSGWQSLQRFDYAKEQSVIFGRYGRLYVQITFEEFPYVNRIQDLLLNYKFDQ